LSVHSLCEGEAHEDECDSCYYLHKLIIKLNNCELKIKIVNSFWYFCDKVTTFFQDSKKIL
jgi:hypothetical protein